MLTMKVKLLSPHAVMPTKAHPEDAGIDLYAAARQHLYPRLCNKIPLDIAVEIPDGYCLVMKCRSSLAHLFTVEAGVIDAGYRGPLAVMMRLHGSLNGEPFLIQKGEKIAQALLLPVPPLNIIQVNELSSTVRGQGGFGSTGK